MAAPGELADVTVFDSACASVYVEEKTNVVYRPFGLDLFPKLVDACEQVKARLQAAIGALGPARAFSDLQRETAVGNLIRSLNAKTAAEVLERLSTITEEELRRLDMLRTTVAHLDREEPAVRAEELRLRARRFMAMTNHVERVDGILAEARAANLREAHEAKRATGQAARLISGVASQEEPLGAIGSDPWKTLWIAARHYSEQEAYPGQPFPIAEDEARCVLCQQPLGAEGPSACAASGTLSGQRRSRPRPRQWRPSMR